MTKITFQIVPDYFREREPATRGRVPTSDLSRALLNGQTIFIEGPRKTWGSLYTLATNHGKMCKTRRTILRDSNGPREGTLVWFDSPQG